MKTRETLNPSALYWATFNRFELRLPGQCVIDCSSSGAVDNAVAYWTPIVFEQASKDNFPLAPDAEKIRQELSEYGSWDNDELADDEANKRRLVWISAGGIADEENPDCTEPVK